MRCDGTTVACDVRGDERLAECLLRYLMTERLAVYSDHVPSSDGEWWTAAVGKQNSRADVGVVGVEPDGPVKSLGRLRGAYRCVTSSAESRRRRACPSTSGSTGVWNALCVLVCVELSNTRLCLSS